MKSGQYVVDSIENSLAKLLYSEDETIEEIVNVAEFDHRIRQGDIVEIQLIHNKLTFTVLEEETQRRREKASDLMNKLRRG